MNISLKSFSEIPFELQMESRKWRNSKEVTKYFKINYISKEQHQSWLESLKEPNPKSIAFVIMKDNIPIGVTYFHSINYNKKTADWGIYIYSKNLRGQGIGNIVLSKCIIYAKKTLKLTNLYLDVLIDNYRAIKLYEKMGFNCVSGEENYTAVNPIFLRYELKL